MSPRPDPANGPGAAAGPREPGGAPEEDPIQVLFVANRGEIARRIATTAGRLGIAPILPLVASPGPSAGGAPSAGPDPGPGAVDLLDPAAVVAAARSAGADAVHPGYGFLAESPELAEAVLAAGLTWVGPPAAAIRALGDKASARDIARSVGVPVAAGEEPADQSDASLTAAAGRIGLPLLVKPAAGGGGKGIRIVTARDDLAPALEAARREAGRAFADERLILERYVAPARHVEVQVMADAHGSVVHLGDRDCSLQRRHQKVLEEAPAPGVDASLRDALRAAAIRVTAAVGYVGAGTCEFLVADDGTWVFLEMNARLQVEHPVTELILGRDLVADQLGIAAGLTLGALGLEQGDVEDRLRTGGHAIEVRLNAEDPGSGFLPASGPVVAVSWPAGAATFGPVGPGGIRVDAGIAAGDVVEGRFDPLLAKVIAHGRDRDEALARLRGALEATEVLGVVTNLAFLRRVLRIPEVAEGRVRTGTMEGAGTSGQAASGEGASRQAADGPTASAEAASPESASAEAASSESASLLAASDPPVPEAAWSAAAGLLLDGPAPWSATGIPATSSVPWPARAAARPGRSPAWGGGWRANLPARVRLVADRAAGEEERVVALEPVRLRGDAAVASPGHGRIAAGDGTAAGDGRTAAGHGPTGPFAARDGEVAYVSVEGRSTAFRLASPPSLARAGIRSTGAAAGEASTELVAPMPGRVVAVHVAAGADVEPGDRVVTLEAMKMEHVVAAPRSARVREVLVREGDQVARGRAVATLEDRR